MSSLHILRKTRVSLFMFSPWCLPSCLSVPHIICNKPVLWALSAALTGWTPASWWTPASPAGFWSRSAPRLRRCWPRTWPASVGTSPSCGPSKQRSEQLWPAHQHIMKLMYRIIDGTFCCSFLRSGYCSLNLFPQRSWSYFLFFFFQCSWKCFTHYTTVYVQWFEAYS